MKHAKHQDSSLEEVELENHSFFSFFDSSMQLILDSSSQSNHQTYIISILIYSAFIFLFTLICPKPKTEKHISIPLSAFEQHNFTTSFTTKGMNIRGKKVLASFSATRIHPHHMHFDKYRETHNYRFRFGKRFFQHYINASYWFDFRFSDFATIHFIENDQIISTKTIEHHNSQLHFSHHHLSSDQFDLFEIQNDNADQLRINITIRGHTYPLNHFYFTISVNNNLCTIFEKYYFLTLLVLSVIAISYLLFNCQRRYEQIGTIIFFCLFCLTNFSMYMSLDLTWKIMSKIMILYLQFYMLYLISFIANKHRSYILYCNFLLMIISFVSDIVHTMFSSGLWFDFNEEHHLFWHFITMAVSLSTAAAMFHSIDDPPAFVIYTVCLCLEFLAVFVTDDMLRFFPTLNNFLNLRVFFISVHSIIVLILFIYHRTSSF